MRTSPLFKALVAAGLVLFLLVPIGMVSSVIRERKGRADEAATEVSGTWGAPQTVTGPALVLPYKVSVRDKDGNVKTCVEKAVFLPDRLEVQGDVAPEVRSRGIFRVPLYRLDLRLSATFPHPDPAALGIDPADVLWHDAAVTIGLTDTRGIKEQVAIRWDGADLPLEPGSGGSPLAGSGLHRRLPGLGNGPAGPHTAALSLRLQGSQSLAFTPLGVETDVALRSAWRDPSFYGAFLPDRRTVGPTGFSAIWKVSHYGRSYPQRFTSGGEGSDTRCVCASAFGVRLFLPVDHYQLATRAIKYAVLFVVLTFLAFFLFEVLSGLSLHPLQYLLVGAALALFFLLLVSLSEHVGFGPAYAVAATATVLLIGLYTSRILASRGRAAAVAGLLAALYGTLFVLLKQEDYALLLGSVALFAILAAVMWLTRGVDWGSGGVPRLPFAAPPAGRAVPPPVPAV